MAQSNVIAFPEIRYASHGGGCPVCGRNSGYLNIHIEHWFICRAHKTKWLAGRNLFESWKQQTLDQHISAMELLKKYRNVQPGIAEGMERLPPLSWE